MSLVLILVGMVLMLASAFFRSSGGAFIWILPFPPIVIGAGSYIASAIAVDYTITILGVALFVALWEKKTGV